jgi:DNA-binding NtrC family response regulator
MDGKQVFNELHRMDDDVRVVMTSGYNEQEVINQFRELPLTGFVQKPFRIENLRAILARALGDDLPEAEEK